MPEPATPPAPRRGCPQTPEGKARAALDATRHGLRARHFALLPHEDPAEFAALARVARSAYRPADAIERELVEGIVAALWRELRADRLEAETLADIAPADAGRSCGSDLREPGHRAGLAVLLRYRAQAAQAVRRAQHALARHRRLIEAATAKLLPDRTNELAPHGTNELDESDARRNDVGRSERGGVEQARNAVTARLDAERKGVSADPARTLSHDPTEIPNRPHDPDPEPADPLPPATADPPKLDLRETDRIARNPLDSDLLRSLGRDPDLVLPVPGVDPAAWPIAQKHADPTATAIAGQRPYRRVPHLPWTEWLRFQHFVEPRSAPEPRCAAQPPREARPPRQARPPGEARAAGNPPAGPPPDPPAAQTAA